MLTILEKKELEVIWNEKTNYGKNMTYKQFIDAGEEIINNAYKMGILHNNFLTNASEDDLCTKCKQKAYYKIMGGENCYYCGNEIKLCKGHYVKLFVEMSEVRDFGLIKEAAQDFEERQKVEKR